MPPGIQVEYRRSQMLYYSHPRIDGAAVAPAPFPPRQSLTPLAEGQGSHRGSSPGRFSGSPDLPATGPTDRDRPSSGRKE
ncbi:MAG: hypothetical protein MZV64_28450 [Ignavibacteriales bacterium]|nr:hypothetical protein [Ignavibacteriales bacterium]